MKLPLLLPFSLAVLVSPCKIDGDCPGGSSCSKFRGCVEAGGFLDGTEVTDWLDLMSHEQLQRRQSTECTAVSTALAKSVGNDLADPQCEPMFNALNVSTLSLDRDDPGLGQTLVEHLFQSTNNIGAVCGSPCFPRPYAQGKRAVEVCLTGGDADVMDDVCAANADGNFCLSYVDDIAALVQSATAAGSSRMDQMKMIKKQCGFIEELGCCFRTILNLFDFFKAQLAAALEKTHGTKLEGDPRLAQLESINSLMQAFSGNDLALLTQIVCRVVIDPTCPIPAAITEESEKADRDFAMPAVTPHQKNGKTDKADKDEDERIKKRNSGRSASGAVLAVGLLGAAVTAAFGFWWYKRSQKRSDGAMTINMPMQFQSGPVHGLEEENPESSNVVFHALDTESIDAQVIISVDAQVIGVSL